MFLTIIKNIYFNKLNLSLLKNSQGDNMISKWVGVTEFICSGETQSFTKAAKRLNTSTAQVSRKVKHLEAELSTQLFYRTTRLLTLTEEGRIYYQYSKKADTELLNAQSMLSQYQNSAEGNIRITAPTTYGDQIIAPIVNDFLLKYEQINIDLILTNQRVNLIEDRIDLAIRLGNLEDSTLICKKLGSRKKTVCVSPEYAEKYGIPHDLEDLKNFNCINGLTDYWRFKSGKVKVSGCLRCNNSMAVLKAGLQHLGIIQLPDYHLKEQLKAGSLIKILTEYEADKEGIWALYPNTRQPSYNVKLFLDYLIEHIPSSVFSM